MNIVAAGVNNLFAGPNMLIILVVVLLLFGAKRLPELARGLGQAINEFNKAKDDMQRHIANADQPAVRPPVDTREHQGAAPVVPAAPAVAAAAPVEPQASETKQA